MRWKTLLLGAAAFGLSGCASFGNSFFSVTEVTVERRVDRVDLITMLDPENRRRYFLSLNGRELENFRTSLAGSFKDAVRILPIFNSFNIGLSGRDENEIEELDLTHLAFYTYGAEFDEFAQFVDGWNFNNIDDLDALSLTTPNLGWDDLQRRARPDMLPVNAPTDFWLRSPLSFTEGDGGRYLAIRRNAIQDRIVAASNEACLAFVDNLARSSTNVNFVTDVLTLTFAGLGAVFVDPATVRSLAGAGAITAGIGASYRNRFLQDRTIEVFTEAIKTSRDLALRNIERRRTGPNARNGVTRTPQLAQGRQPPSGEAMPDPQTMSVDRAAASARLDAEAAQAALDAVGQASDLALAAQASADPTPEADQPTNRIGRLFQIATTSAEQANAAANQAETARDAVRALDAQIAQAQAGAQASAEVNLAGGASPSPAVQALQTMRNQQIQMARSASTRARNARQTAEQASRLAADLVNEPGLGRGQAPTIPEFGLTAIDLYTVEAAIADAIDYHSRCSIPKALTQIEDSLRETTSPSLEAVARTLRELNTINGILNPPNTPVTTEASAEPPGG
ncbi:MAG: hypothetical protein ACFB2Z_13055 [Maricaulaceae bacterium]